MGTAINQFGRLCRPQSPVSLSPCESSNGTYSPISLTETARTEERGPFSDVEQIVHDDCEIDEDD